MIKNALRKRLPTAESFANNRWLRWLKPWLGHPRLWHLHRRSVALGVSIGLVTGLIPGPVQMLLAALVAIPLRANIPAAVFTTLYTNPLTFVPLYVLAFSIGRLVTNDGTPMQLPRESEFNWSAPWQAFVELFRWIGSMGDTLLIGLAIQCTVFAIAGYVLTMGLWRAAVSYLWWRRRRMRRVPLRP